MISLFLLKDKKDVYFLFTGGVKWNAAEYLTKNPKRSDFVLFQTQTFISLIERFSIECRK